MQSWNFSCPDWEERLFAGHSLVPDLPLDHAEAVRAETIFGRLRLHDIVGQPAISETGSTWFQPIVRAIFGSIDRESGRRMVPNVLVVVPKKNGKTTNAAGLMITALLMNRRPNAHYGLFGPTQQVADWAYDAAAGMVEADASLAKLLHPQPHLKKITNRVNGAELKVMTFSPKVATGGKYAGWLLDEVHLLGDVPYAERVIAQLRGARTAFPETFGLMITTQSDKIPAGVFRSELSYARQVRDGKIENPIVLPVIYELPERIQTSENKEWRARKLWPLIQPNAGHSIDLDILSSEYEAARAKGAGEEALWASQHLNVEIGLALHNDRWRGADYWLGAADTSLTLDTLLDRSEVVTIGIDGGGLDDLFALAVIGRCRETRDWLVWVRAWVQSDVLELRKDIAATLEGFSRDGDLVICEDATRDITDAVDLIAAIRDRGLLPDHAAIGLDPYGIAAVVDELASRNIGGDEVKAIGQGTQLSSAVWGLERKLKDGTLWHGSQNIMAWCIGNARAEQRGNATLITKQTAGKAKIDPLVAVFNAAMLMSRNPEARDGGMDAYFNSLAQSHG